MTTTYKTKKQAPRKDHRSSWNGRPCCKQQCWGTMTGENQKKIHTLFQDHDLNE